MIIVGDCSRPAPNPPPRAPNRSVTATPTTRPINALNQYTARDVTGAVDVTGIARAGATVTVNGDAATARQGDYFSYDDQGRQVSKVVSNWTGSAWALLSERRFVRDGWPASRSSESVGWNLVAELNGNLAVVRTYLWGTDLSRSMHGAADTTRSRARHHAQHEATWTKEF